MKIKWRANQKYYDYEDIEALALINFYKSSKRQLGVSIFW